MSNTPEERLLALQAKPYSKSDGLEKGYLKKLLHAQGMIKSHNPTFQIMHNAECREYEKTKTFKELELRLTKDLDSEKLFRKARGRTT